MQQSKSYARYFLKAKGRHNVHSPFVFDFVDTCLTTKVDKNFRIARKIWMKLLSKQREAFTIKDLGAGSKAGNTKRTVAQLARNASSNGIYGNVLWKIAHHYKPKNILELGTSIGVGSVHLKNALPDSNLITIEGCDRIQKEAYTTFEYWKMNHVFPFCADFDHFLSLPNHWTYDLVFIDGNHQKAPTLRYLNQLMEHTHNDTLFIFDDIRWSDEMWSAWQEIVADERFHLTIDLGRMGLVWKRTQQTKEHFTLRPVIRKGKLV